MNALREGWIITQRDLIHWLRQPAMLVFGLLFSVMLLLIFGLLLGGAIAVPGASRSDYIAFLLPGMFALTMLFGLETTMSAISADAAKGVTDRFRSLPISSAAVVLGRSGADLLYSALTLGVLMVGGLAIGWRIDAGLGSALVAVALLLWLRFALLWVGIFLGLTFQAPGATTAIQVLVWPVGFLSNAFVSPETMPAWLGAVAQWNPISATATAARQLFGNPSGLTGGWFEDNAILLAIILPLLLTVVFLPLSARAYRRLRR
jgi:ABC-2 type transport system permease protein